MVGPVPSCTQTETAGVTAQASNVYLAFLHHRALELSSTESQCDRASQQSAAYPQIVSLDIKFFLTTPRPDAPSAYFNPRNRIHSSTMPR